MSENSASSMNMSPGTDQDKLMDDNVSGSATTRVLYDHN